MKKLILVIAGTAFSIAMVNAQSDSIRTKPATTMSKTQSTMYQNYPTRDMKKISSSEIPASLRTTLQGTEYKGWENGTIYLNSTTNEYSYQAAPVKGNNSTSKDMNAVGWYRFDQSGKRITDLNPKD